MIQSKFLKSTCALLLIMGLVLAGPKNVSAGISIDPTNLVPNTLSAIKNFLSSFYDGKKYGKDIAVAVLKRLGAKVLQKTVKKTVNWALSGFKGQPFYLQNEDSTLNNVAENELTQMLDALNKDCSGNEVCPFARSISKGLIQAHVQGNKDGGNKFNLNKILGPDYQEFQNDFSKGGWKGWEAFTQNPYNNPFGAYLSSSIELSQKQQEAATKIGTELNRNQGFLSLRKCVAYKDGAGPTKQITYASVKNTANNNKKYTYPFTDAGKSYMCNTKPNPDSWKCLGKDVETNPPCKNPNLKKSLFISGSCISGNGQSVGAGIKDTFDDTYALPGATVDNCERYEVTTPGAIAKEQLAKSLNSTIDEQIAAKSTGSSILDSVVDMTANLISNGLDKLVTKQTNKSGQQNIYTGQIQNTIVLGNNGGSSSNSPWFVDTTGVVIQDPNNLRKPSAEILDGIKDTQAEIALVNEAYTILQEMPYSLELLDKCMPGPDIGWEARFETEFERGSRKLNKKSEKDKKKGERAADALSRLELFKELDKEKIKRELLNLDGKSIPIAPLLHARIKAGKDLGIQSTVDEKSIKLASVLQNLKIIEEDIRSGKKDLETDKIKFLEIKDIISNEETINETRADLNALKRDVHYSFDKKNPSSLIAKCIEQRKAKPEMVRQDNSRVLFNRWQWYKTCLGKPKKDVFGVPLPASQQIADLQCNLQSPSSTPPANIDPTQTITGGGSQNVLRYNSDVVIGDLTSDLTLTLPSMSGNKDKYLSIFRDSSASGSNFTVTIQPQSGDTLSPTSPIILDYSTEITVTGNNTATTEDPNDAGEDVNEEPDIMLFFGERDLEDPDMSPYLIGGYTQNQEPWKSKPFKLNFGRIYRAPFREYTGL